MNKRWIACILAAVLLLAALVPAAGIAEAKASKKNVKLKLGVKETCQIDPASVPGGAGKTLEYKSKNPKIAAVSDAGLITAKKRGTTQIAVGYGKTVLAVCEVTVAAAPKSVKLSDKSAILYVGETKKLKATLPKNSASNKLTFASSDEAVATVDAKGNVKAVAKGNAVISVETFNGKKAECKLAVLSGKAPTKLSVNASAINLQVGGTFKLIPSVGEGNDAIYKFSSKNKKIAKVSSDGLITGVKKGTTKITVKTHNDLSKTVTVKVSAKRSLTEVYGYLTNSAETYKANVEALKLKKDTTEDSGNSVMYYDSQLALILSANSCQISLNPSTKPKYSVQGVDVSMTPGQAAAVLAQQGWSQTGKRTVDGVEVRSFAKSGDASRTIDISTDDGADIRSIDATLSW